MRFIYSHSPNHAGVDIPRTLYLGVSAISLPNDLLFQRVFWRMETTGRLVRTVFCGAAPFHWPSLENFRDSLYHKEFFARVAIELEQPFLSSETSSSAGPLGWVHWLEFLERFLILFEIHSRFLSILQGSSAFIHFHTGTVSRRQTPNP